MTRPAAFTVRAVRSAKRIEQRGQLLIEGLIAILVFSVGILGILGIVLKMTVGSQDARYRVEAAQYAESLISEMRTVDVTTLSTVYATNGAAFNSWTSKIHSASTLPLANVASTTLPLTTSFAPPVTAGAQTFVTATITIRWRAPQDTEVDSSNNGVAHQYVTTAVFNN